MDFSFNRELALSYKSNSQKIRVMSEAWLAENISCPVCGNEHLKKLDNNKPVSDFQCERCREIFELKSKHRKIGRKIAAGAYAVMIERITSNTNPNLFVLLYSDDLQVISLFFIPKFLFVPGVIEKRKPLSDSARRAGWVGCNILYDHIPEQGKLVIISEQKLSDVNLIISAYNDIKKISLGSIEKRGWLFDVLSCVNSIKKDEFSLSDMYGFVDKLQAKHTDNHNVEAKIRQQLQILRDNGFIEFSGRGRYKKVLKC